MRLFKPSYPMGALIYFLGLFISLSPYCAHTTPLSPHQTQNQLKELELKIKKLRNTLAFAQDKQGVLNKELAITEKQIGKSIHQLQSLENDMEIKAFQIKKLDNKVSRLNKQLTTQQQLLAQHIRARYQIGEYQALKWIIDQDSPYRVSRVLTYYQYLIKSRQTLMDDIENTRKKISFNQKKMHDELANTEALRLKLNEHQHQLQKDKRYHTTLIDALNSHIQSTQSTLNATQKNKENLSRLLKKLAEQSIVRNTLPITQMRKKLPLPVQTKRQSIVKMNQGVTFFADEGAVVTAVYPGKVVFSNWLNGYGLLLILDHGQGLMSLYAHNQSLYKHKGDKVYQGEQIARVGHSGGIRQNGLYFEIRVKGKAVSPLDWLS